MLERLAVLDRPGGGVPRVPGSLDLGRQTGRGVAYLNQFVLGDGAIVDHTGNLAPMPDVFPDYPAPIVRNGTEGRELVLARWGMPSPAFALKGRKADPGVTNIRNSGSPHWRRWLGPEHRCLVPLTAFSENEHRPDGSKPPVWFALGEDRPLAFFAGIWCRWTSVRKLKEGEVEADLFGFLTTEPSEPVRTYHPKAMPVILTEPDEIERWMTAPAIEAVKLQRPRPDGRLRVVSYGGRGPDAARETLGRLRLHHRFADRASRSVAAVPNDA